MKVALNPAELRLIVDALDDKHQFQLQSGGRGGHSAVTLRIIWHRILRAIWHNSPSKVRADRARRASDRSRRRRAGLFLIARAAGLG
jgi:hypothetical protein